MTIFVLSHLCGHCVHSQAVLGPDEFYDVKLACIGRPCPVCGVRPRTEDDLRVATSTLDLDAIRAGTSPWDKAERPGGAFAGFGDTGAAQTFERGALARSLRGKMQSRAQGLRKSDYEVLSKGFAVVGGLQLGLEAFQEGDHDRAVVWLTRAAEASPEPTAVAIAQLHLGLCWLVRGESGKAEAALRIAADRGDADVSIRALAANHLGTARRELNDLTGARAAWERAIDFGVPAPAATAAINLGTLENLLGNPRGAEKYWELAFRTAQDEENRTYAAYNLGGYWGQAGDARKAEKYYRIAAQARTPDVAAGAREGLRLVASMPKRRWGRR